MLTPRVAPIKQGTGHQPADRELRCQGCGNRMFSADAPALLDSGLRCSRCLGALRLMPPARMPAADGRSS